MKKWMIFTALAAALCAPVSLAQTPKHENETALSGRWCDNAGGVSEWRLADGSRVDCLLGHYAVEHDFTHGLKPLECLGQSAYYAGETGREPLCVLIWRRSEQTTEEFIKAARRALIGGLRANVEVWCVDDTLLDLDCATGEEIAK